MSPGSDGASTPATFRRPTAYVLAWAFIVVAAGTAVLSMFTAASTLSDHLQVTGLLFLLAWFVLLVGVCPRVVVGDDGLVVVSWFVRWDVPWSAVRSVTGSKSVQINLKDGREIIPSVGGASVLSTIMRNATQRRILAAIEARRPAEPDAVDTPVRRRIDLRPVPFLIVLAVSVVVTVVVAQVVN
ncbi:MAG TPA: PH domain-containing protein [Pseudonocardiaceae bacterium]|nr:PH domain-containing protein [Pseudonocardiaceae bacterium]